MALANCKNCGKLFRRVTSDVCPDCLQEEEELLRETREYLREHPDAMRHNVVEDLDLERPLLEKWIEEGIIMVKDPQEKIKKCPICGRKVQEGHTYCRTCMFKQLQAKSKGSSAQDRGESERKGMHYKVKKLTDA